MGNYGLNFIEVATEKSPDANIFWFPQSFKLELLLLSFSFVLLILFFVVNLFFAAPQNILYISELKSSGNRVCGRYGRYNFSTQILALPEAHRLEQGTIFPPEIYNSQIYQAMKKQNM